jgi:hypothetical protein
MKLEYTIAAVLASVLIAGGIIYSVENKKGSVPESALKDIIPSPVLNFQDAPAEKKVEPGVSMTEAEKLKQEKSSKYPLAPEISTPDGFVNTGGKPITLGELRGKKVVLLDIWTYSFINFKIKKP